MQTLLQDNQELIASLRELFSFENLSTNDFLLKKFDPQTGCINSYWLSRENSISASMQYHQLDQICLQQTLQAHNNDQWIYDSVYDLIRPVFHRSRRQIQVLIQKNKIFEFLEQLSEFKSDFAYEPRTQNYFPNQSLVRLFIVLKTEDTAQLTFDVVLRLQSEFDIQTAKMEDVPLFDMFINAVVTRQQRLFNYQQKYLDHQYQFDQSQVNNKPARDFWNNDENKENLAKKSKRNYVVDELRDFTGYRKQRNQQRG